MYEKWESIEYKNHTINIYQDEYIDPMDSPRQCDNLGTMVCWHSRYVLGDEQPSESPEEFIVELAGLDWNHWDGITEELVDKAWKIIDKKYIVLPLYLYDHSGITMNTSGFYCPWDSGQVGYIYISLEKIRKEYSVKRVSKQMRERIAGYLKNEVKTYDDFLTGRVFWYEVINSDGERVDSCHGFFGTEWDKNGLMDYAKSSIKWEEENKDTQFYDEAVDF